MRALATVLLCLLPPLHGQDFRHPSPPEALPPGEFQARRLALAQAIRAAEPDRPAVVLVRGANADPGMGAFVQEQDFLYLSGVAEPGLALLLMPSAEALALDEILVPPFSRMSATWDGNFLAPGEATAQRTGFAAATNVRSLADRLDSLLAADEQGQRAVLYTLTQPAPRTGSTPSKAADSARAIQRDAFDGRSSREQALRERLLARYPGLEVRSLEPFLTRLRVQKSPAELVLLRAATQAAADGIAEAMRSARPGAYEYELAAVARYVHSLRGGGPDAYAAIVGAGPNGCILHYNKNDRQLRDDDLIVMDYAPTIQGYASDVTRTFPASGRFTPAQRKLVQDVYEIQQELLAMVKPGARLSTIGRRCQELLLQRGYRSDHGPCHHVGLAVHDPSVDVLAAGMVITVEPGAYLRDQGMGCRIEDTLLVTADGYESLSTGLPANPDSIEAFMQQPGLLRHPVGLPRGH